MRDAGNLVAPESWARATLGSLRRDLSRGIEPAAEPDTAFELYSIPAHDAGGPEIVFGKEVGSNKQTVAPQTVLLSKINPRINRVRIVGPSRGLQQIASTEWIPFWPVTGVEPEYLAYFLQREEFRSFLAQNASGVGGSLMRVRAATMADVTMALPSSSEQRRIVAALEEQLSRIDAGVAALERAKANLERYRASVLKAACEGRLVPTEAELARAEGRSYEPASELLARILSERRTRWAADQLARMNARGKPPKDDAWKKKYPEPAAPDKTALPELPEGWCWASLAAIAELKGGLTKGQKRGAGEVVRPVPYLRVANVQRGFLDLAEMKTIDATEDEIAELRLQPGDVLFNEGGDRDKLGRGWVWSGELPLCVHQNHVFRARIVADAIDPRFLSHYGNSFGQSYFLTQGTQTTNLASINLTKLSALPVPIPPRREQRRIMAEIDRLLSAAAAADASIRQDALRAFRLRQSLLAHAFSGKLAPQDPTDEPASVLLERIRKEREASDAEKPKRPARRASPRGRPRKTAPKGKR